MEISFRRVLLGGAAILVVLSAAPATAQSIDEALAAAYRNNPQILAERARLRATDEGVPRALSNWRPTVTISGTAGKGTDTLRQDTSVGDTKTDSTRTPYSTLLSVTQPIYRGGRTEAEINRSENLVQRGRAQLQSIEQQVLLDAATAYTNLLRDQAVLELTINNEQVLRRQLEAAQDRFSVGEITRTDVAQAESRLARAQADRIQAEGNLTSSRANYLRVIGQQPGRLSQPRMPPNLPATESAAVKASADNPSVIGARFAERAALDDVELVFGEKLPTVQLQGNLSRGHEITTRGLERDVAEAIVVVSVPIYQAGQVDARVRESKQTASQRRIEVEDAARRAREDATRGYEGLNTARAAIVAFQAQVRAAQIALEGVEQEARVGSRTVLDVLDAEQELFTARVNLVRAQRDEIVAAFQLSSAVGNLTARDLSLPVEIYDPTIYYNQTRGRWYGTDIGEEGQGKRNE
jgi:TolC family type I secretion outer membrane protein